MLRPLLLTALATAMTSACGTAPLPANRSSASIDSHRSTAFDGHLARLVVLLARSDHPDEDQLFRTFIEEELRKRRVNVLVAAVSEATLEAGQPLQTAELADRRRAIRVLGPEAVMRIKATDVTTAPGRPQWRTSIVYQAELFVMSSDALGERVWRAELQHAGAERNMEKRFALAAACLVERLESEGILADE